MRFHDFRPFPLRCVRLERKKRERVFPRLLIALLRVFPAPPISPSISSTRHGSLPPLTHSSGMSSNPLSILLHTAVVSSEKVASSRANCWNASVTKVFSRGWTRNASSCHMLSGETGESEQGVGQLRPTATGHKRG